MQSYLQSKMFLSNSIDMVKVLPLSVNYLGKILVVASKFAIYKKWKEEGQIAEKRIEVAIVDEETKKTIKDRR